MGRDLDNKWFTWSEEKIMMKILTHIIVSFK
jgi:hypothetical protein